MLIMLVLNWFFFYNPFSIIVLQTGYRLQIWLFYSSHHDYANNDNDNEMMRPTLAQVTDSAIFSSCRLFIYSFCEWIHYNLICGRRWNKRTQIRSIVFYLELRTQKPYKTGYKYVKELELGFSLRLRCCWVNDYIVAIIFPFFLHWRVPLWKFNSYFLLLKPFVFFSCWTSWHIVSSDAVNRSTVRSSWVMNWSLASSRCWHDAQIYTNFKKCTIILIWRWRNSRDKNGLHYTHTS